MSISFFALARGIEMKPDEIKQLFYFLEAHNINEMVYYIEATRTQNPPGKSIIPDTRMKRFCAKIYINKAL